MLALLWRLQVLVAAINGIDGGPVNFNYQALAAIASVLLHQEPTDSVLPLQKSSLNSSVPLVWDLFDDYNLTAPKVHHSLVSNMGCCDCALAFRSFFF